MEALDDYVMLIGLNSVRYITDPNEKIVIRPVGAPRISKFSPYRIGFVCLDRADNEPKYIELSMRHMKYLCQWSTTMGDAFYGSNASGDWLIQGMQANYLCKQPISPEEIEKAKSSYLLDLQESFSTPTTVESIVNLLPSWESKVDNFIEAQETLFTKLKNQNAQKKKSASENPQKEVTQLIQNLKVSDDLKQVLLKIVDFAESSGW